MSGTQVWFGTTQRPLAGWYHAPVGSELRGGVVVCPPFGMEAACAGDTLRELADDLVKVGFAVLRISYDGMGDSAGDADDPLRVDAWKASIRQGLEYLNALGHRWRAVVGLRLGATLAACEAADNGALDALVLWDACLSGRTFLREQQLLLRQVSNEDTGHDESVYGPGTTFTPETAQALSALDPASAIEAITAPTLILTRKGIEPRGLPPRNSRPDLEFAEIEGQEDLLAVDPLFARVPLDTLRAISQWLMTQAHVDSYELVEATSGQATVALTLEGLPIVEFPTFIGSNGVFGILTVPPNWTGKTSVIFLNAGVLDHTGPSRLWVELARRWAGLGFECLRFDFSGIGESPAPAGTAKSIPLVDAALGQLQDAIAYVTRDKDKATDVVLVGLCSGADIAIRAGLEDENNRVKAVYAINPAFGSDPMEKVVTGESGLAPAAGPARESWFAALGKLDRLVPLARKAPDGVWRMLNRLDMTILKADALISLAEKSVDTFVIGDSLEAAGYLRGRRARVRRLEHGGNLAIVTCEPLDHTVLGPLARQRVTSALSAHLVVTSEPLRALASGMSSGMPEQVAELAKQAGPARIVFVEKDQALPDLRADERYKEAWIVVCEEGSPRAVEVVDLADSDEAIKQQLSRVMSSVTPSKEANSSYSGVSAGELPRISVVIPSIVSRVDELAVCLDSISELDYPDFEVVLVDNRRRVPSDDPLPDLVRDRAGVRVVRQPVPGISAARNMGIASADGEIIAFTDDDVRVDSAWLRAIGTRFASDPRLDAVTGLILPAELEHPAQVWFERYYGGFNGQRVFDAMTLESDPQSPELLRGSQVVVKDSGGTVVRRFAIYGVGAYSAGANMAFKKASLERIGGFDLALGTGTPARGGEDLAAMITLLWNGGVVGYEPSAFVHHRHRQEYSELLAQMDGNGLGFTAMLTSLIVHDPRHLLVLGAKLPVAVGQRLGIGRARGPAATKPASTEVAAGPRFPSTLAVHEFRSYFRGPSAYAKSRWRLHAAKSSASR